jgi:hypothetical protein
MTNDERKKLYAALSAPFGEDAIERTDGRVTGRGYDTTGIKYQYIVNRLNEVLGIGAWRTEQQVSVRESQTAKGRTAYDATCNLTLQLGTWLDGKFLTWAESFATGGHTSLNETDARKGRSRTGSSGQPRRWAADDRPTKGRRTMTTCRQRCRTMDGSRRGICSQKDERRARNAPSQRRRHLCADAVATGAARGGEATRGHV